MTLSFALHSKTHLRIPLYVSKISDFQLHKTRNLMILKHGALIIDHPVQSKDQN